MFFWIIGAYIIGALVTVYLAKLFVWLSNDTEDSLSTFVTLGLLWPLFGPILVVITAILTTSRLSDSKKDLDSFNNAWSIPNSHSFSLKN